MGKVHRTARKIIVSLIGFPLFVLGLVLIPVPGPGLLISFLALILLSFEYEWAAVGKKKATNKFKEIYAAAKARSDKIENWGDTHKKKQEP